MPPPPLLLVLAPAEVEGETLSFSASARTTACAFRLASLWPRVGCDFAFGEPAADVLAFLFGVLGFFFVAFFAGAFFGVDFRAGLFALLGPGFDTEGLDLVTGDMTRSVGSFFTADFVLDDRLFEATLLPLCDLLSALALLDDGVDDDDCAEDVDG